MTIFANHIKRKMGAGQVVLGFGVYHLRTSATGLLAAATDHDWLFLDMEHGAFSLHEVTQICAAALPTGVTPIVRVSGSALDEGSRALDGGAMGIVVPHVDTVAQARRVADAFRYPPHGHRSWGGPPVTFGFRAPGNAEAQAATDPEILVIAMIESAEAVVNAAAIAAVDGIDLLFVGASDLTADMGISGQTQHPRLIEAFETVRSACAASGKILGMGGIYDPVAAGIYMRFGPKFILTGADHTYLVDGARQRSTAFRTLAEVAG